MKKIIIAVITALICSIASYAQKDTTVIASSVCSYEVEYSTSKTGNTKTDYIVYYRGTYYLSDRTSYKRYETAKRYGVIPNMALVSDDRTKAKKIIVL